MKCRVLRSSSVDMRDWEALHWQIEVHEWKGNDWMGEELCIGDRDRRPGGFDGGGVGDFPGEWRSEEEEDREFTISYGFAGSLALIERVAGNV